MATHERWYEDAFGSDYPRVYAHRDLAAARFEVSFLAPRGVRGRVLDLCCGFGRHTLALVEHGADAVGLDLSLALLRRARELPGYETRLSGRLVRGDALALPFGAGRFDALVNLFSSFGYFGPQGDERMLAEVARVARHGATIVLDLMNPPHVRARLVLETRREGEGFVLRERRALEDGGRRVVKEVELEPAEGAVRRWREDVRMYDEREIHGLLAREGIETRALFGDFDGSPCSPASPRMIVLATRR